jgi:predicted short-subunit dehydrogenase-like oxidoreductase (DUF2520 family)
VPVLYYCSIMDIIIIGTGNVARVLGKKLLQANHTILQVYGRNQNTLQACASALQAEPVTDLTLLNKAAELCIIATSDSAIPFIAAKLQLPDTIIVHTSGGVAIKVLQIHRQYGVLYPLQSLRKELPYLPKVPLFIDGNNDEVSASLITLAKTISDEVHIASDEERLKLHIAAVFCSNFTNHLFALADHFCSSEQLKFDYLLPLIEETVHRMQFAAPENLQTGPAIRKDEVTIQRHLQVLQSYPSLAYLYKVLSTSIQNGEAEN